MTSSAPYLTCATCGYPATADWVAMSDSCPACDASPFIERTASAEHLIAIIDDTYGIPADLAGRMHVAVSFVAEPVGDRPGFGETFYFATQQDAQAAADAWRDRGGLAYGAVRDQGGMWGPFAAVTAPEAEPASLDLPEQARPAAVVHSAQPRATSARGTYRPGCSCGWSSESNGTRAHALAEGKRHAAAANEAAAVDVEPVRVPVYLSADEARIVLTGLRNLLQNVDISSPAAYVARDVFSQISSDFIAQDIRL